MRTITHWSSKLYVTISERKLKGIDDVNNKKYPLSWHVRCYVMHNKPSYVQELDGLLGIQSDNPFFLYIFCDIATLIPSKICFQISNFCVKSFLASKSFGKDIIVTYSLFFQFILDMSLHNKNDLNCVLVRIGSPKDETDDKQ